MRPCVRYTTLSRSSFGVSRRRPRRSSVISSRFVVASIFSYASTTRANCIIRRKPRTHLKGSRVERDDRRHVVIRKTRCPVVALRAFVTGGTGFIGRHLVRVLLDASGGDGRNRCGVPSCGRGRLVGAGSAGLRSRERRGDRSPGR